MHGLLSPPYELLGENNMNTQRHVYGNIVRLVSQGQLVHFVIPHSKSINLVSYMIRIELPALHAYERNW